MCANYFRHAGYTRWSISCGKCSSAQCGLEQQLADPVHCAARPLVCGGACAVQPGLLARVFLTRPRHLCVRRQGVGRRRAQGGCRRLSWLLDDAPACTVPSQLRSASL